MLVNKFRAVLLLSVVIPTPLWAAPATGDDVHENSRQEIIITAPYFRDRGRVLAATTVLDGVEIQKRLGVQIGETLAHAPGVSASSFAPGASRPVLRGFQGERIRVLTDGIGAIDASNTSADHAVTLDPITAERMEVLRGPASLLYGSSAIGGVVNVLDRRIPRRVPQGHVHVDALALYSSAADERSLASGVDAHHGPLVVHADASWRKSDDLRVGGPAMTRAYAEAQGLAQSRSRHLENSATKTQTAGVGASWIANNGNIFGMSASVYDSLYGIPKTPGADEAVSIDMQQTRLDLRSEVGMDGIFERIRLRAGLADYKHVELEGDAPGTRFTSTGEEARLELVQSKQGHWRGALGAHYYHRKLEAVGEEAFLPPNQSRQLALFTLQELDMGKLHLEASARLELSRLRAQRAREDAEVAQTAPLENLQRRFTSVSYAAGGSYALTDMWRVGVNLSRAVRAPSAEELFPDGPHAATSTYEVGNIDLVTERSTGLEGFLRAEDAWGSLSLTGYWSRFSGYIYERATGETLDDLPVYQYSQQDATYWGLEMEGRMTLARFESVTISADTVVDMTRATIKNQGPVPRIPAERLLLGLSAEAARWDARLESEFVGAQKRVAAYELPTAGYTLLNASLSWKPFAGQDVAFSLAAHNIFDVVARRHASFLKDFAPLSGRDIRIAVRASF